MFVAVQPVGVAVDAAVFVAEDGLEAGEFPAVRTYAEAVGLFFVARRCSRTAFSSLWLRIPKVAEIEASKPASNIFAAPSRAEIWR